MWNELAAVHGQDAYYDSAGLVAGASSLIEEEETALIEAVGPNLETLRVLHIQCHLGFDAITFARRGAQVTGVDFSSVALAKAERLACRCAVRIEWICADTTEMPDFLSGRFDLAWATMGITCWIADMGAWMRSAARVLAPGGKLVLIDGHPGVATRVDSDVMNRARKPERRFMETGADYATAVRAGPQVQFRHSLEDIVAAARAANLRVIQLREHKAISDGLCIDDLERGQDGRYRHHVEGETRPVLFTLIAGP